MARLLCSLTGAQISGMKFSKTPWFTKCVTLRLGDGRMIRTGQRSGRAWLESRGKHCKTAVRRHDERDRSEEHTSELQSRLHLVCRLLLEKKKTRIDTSHYDPM